MTFFQTLSVVIDLDLKWPEIFLDWIAFFSFLNFSLELGKPECSIEWNCTYTLHAIILAIKRRDGLGVV